MQIVWDEPKREQNLRKHGLDFAAFAAGFAFDTAVQASAKRGSTGRVRHKLVGMFEDRLIAAAILAPLGNEAVSLISLRPASRAERRLHDQSQA